MATQKELWSEALALLGEDTLARRFRLWITGLIRVARQKQANLTPDADFEAQVKAILADLNARTGARFTATDKTKHLIRGRVQEGYILRDFTRVHEVKLAKWGSDPVMKDFLRPTTLYAPSHFDEYLAEWYKSDREKTQLAAKRAAAQAGVERGTSIDGSNSPSAALKAARAKEKQLIAELNSRPWHSLTSWADFVKHTLRFPDPASLEAYLNAAPPRISAMRKAPKMSILVITGQSPLWAEEEYELLASGARPANPAKPQDPADG